MTRTEYYLDFATIPALTLALLMMTPTSWPALAVGLFFWSFAEYVIHRWLFHRVPMFKGPHDGHHAHPSGMTGVTSFQSLAIFLGLCVPVFLGLVPGYFLAGFSMGYFFYIITHHAYHHWQINPGDEMYAGKMRHKMHHSGIEANFGVVTTVWDHIFGTYKEWNKPLH